MSYPGTQLGGRAFNHSSSGESEQEYDRLRGLARDAANKRKSCFDRAHQAYDSGDGAAAHQLSEEGKRHGAEMDRYNKQASEFIFRENNADGRVDSDTIDLHGQFVEEAEDILEQRIKYAQSTGQTHLHVIVGKGNHSVNHIQKIKPRVEQVCQELGLQYQTEANAGRIYINLAGGPAHPPPQQSYGGGGQHGPQHGNQQYGQQHGQQHSQPHGQQHGHTQQHGPQHQPNEQMQMENEVKKALPKIFKALKGCCVVM